MAKKKQKSVVEATAPNEAPVPVVADAPPQKPKKETVWVKTKHGKTYRRAGLVFSGVKAQYQLNKEQLDVVKVDPWLVVVDGD